MDLTKFKAFADDKFNDAKMMISVFDIIENIVGKGENAGNQHFLLFPQCFHKFCLARSLKHSMCCKGRRAKSEYKLRPLWFAII